MPAGIPVATVAIGKVGAINAALIAASILGGSRPDVREALIRYRDSQTAAVLTDTDPPSA